MPRVEIEYSTKIRVVDIFWTPKSQSEWTVFNSTRICSANLWGAMIDEHACRRKFHEKWPDYKEFESWARVNFRDISAQSVQQTVKDFFEAISSATELIKNQRERGIPVTSKYPWKIRKYRDVIYTNQMARIRCGYLWLAHGLDCNNKRIQKLKIKLPKNFILPGRITQVQVSFGRVRITCRTEPLEITTSDDKPIGVDLGVNTLIAATDGDKSLLVSGREAKSLVRFRTKSLKKLQPRVERCKPGSRRRKKLQRAKRKMLNKSERKLKDLHHKATRIVANEFPNAKVFVGKAFNDAARKINSTQAQQVSNVSTAKLTFMLAYKLNGATKVEEHYSSQACPACGCRQRCRRKYKCKDCGYQAPRDVVGALNILDIGLYGEMRPRIRGKPAIKWKHPIKYSGNIPDRPGGTPAGAKTPVARVLK